ncbi:hypothetical protein [Demequina sediminicola]|uniref:hypothetical protein n=1 Tax=Demequina sediminicola TaxID=1095026 RepID=UPI0007808626|nr:hypothetical protein [Demequina sediminicola]
MKIWATLDDPRWQVLLSRLFVFALAVPSAYFATRLYESALDRARPRRALNYGVVAIHQDPPAGNPDSRQGGPDGD